MKDGATTCDLQSIGNSKVRFPIPLYVSFYLCPQDRSKEVHVISISAQCFVSCTNILPNAVLQSFGNWTGSAEHIAHDHFAYAF